MSDKPSPWETETDDEAQSEPEAPRREYQVHAIVVLEESNRYAFGMARWVKSIFSDEPGEIVGTWSKAAMDGTYRVFLEPSIIALHDKSVQAHLEIVKKREADMLEVKGRKKTPRARKPTEPVEPSADIVETQSAIDRIRQSLKK